MIKKISTTEEINEQLSKNGKKTYLDSPKQIEAIVKMNEELEEVRREYRLKEKNSQTSAANVVLTA